MANIHIQFHIIHAVLQHSVVEPELFDVWNGNQVKKSESEP